MMVLTQKFYCIFPYHYITTGEILKMIVYFSLELWFFKIVKLETGFVTFSHIYTFPAFWSPVHLPNTTIKRQW